MALRAVPEHPKFAQLQFFLTLEKFETLGVLESIWHFTGRFAPQGNIGKYSDEAISEWIGWKGDPHALLTALVDSKWIDRDKDYRLVVHDWSQHADHATRLSLKRSKLAFCRSNGPTTDLQNTTPDEQRNENTDFVTPPEGLPGAGAVPEPVPVPEPKAKAAPAKPPLFALPDWISQETWKDFEEMRRRIRKPMTDRARRNILSKLIRLEAQGHRVEDVLNQSITCSWQDVYPLREGGGA